MKKRTRTVSEVGPTASYGWDGIGNLQQSTFNAATNAYTANGLNQYTSILCDSV